MSCSSKRNRLVGSCISTLVSRTNSLVVTSALWRLAFIEWGRSLEVGWGRSERLGGCEHFGRVAGHLDAAPFAAHRALVVDQESAALDAPYLLAVQVLHLDDGEQAAGGLVGVHQQLE